MRARRAAGLLIAAGLFISNLGGAIAGGGPSTVHYPDPVECPPNGDHGLQDCIDSVDSGSTIILTTEVIDEGALISKSLTLRPTNRSLRPKLLGVGVSVEESTGPVPAIDVTVQDLRLTFPPMVQLSAGSGHSVTIRRIEVGKGVLFPEGMTLATSVPASITLEDSFVRMHQEDASEVLTLFANDPRGLVRFRVVGNHITARGDPESGSGIDLAMEGRGSVHADILNNVISDVATCKCGASSGIAIVPDPKFVATVNIVGNTITGSATDGIQQRNGLTTGRLSLDVFNNNFSHNRGNALSLDFGKPGSLVVRGGFNNFFANGFDGQSPGPGNLKVNPRYRDRADRDFRLRAGSPLIDKGLTCSPGGVANPDAAGRHRLKGPAVDIGAYERDAPRIDGVVRVGTNDEDALLGTDGRDILCGYDGSDVLRGGAGPDYIDAGSGPDRATGGTGVDRVLGNSGDDVLCTRDSAGGDRADGGSGRDRARTDGGDTRVSIEGSAGC